MNKITIISCAFILLSHLLFSEDKEIDIKIKNIAEALQNPYIYQSVNVITGEYCESETDISLPGPYPLKLRRNYTSQDPITHGWHFNHPNILCSEGEIPDEWSSDTVHYTYDHAQRLRSVARTNPEKTKTYNAIELSYIDGKKTICEVKGSDNSQFFYTFEEYQPSRAPHPFLLTQIKNTKGWEVNYQYINHPRERRKLLKKREEPNGRFLITEYYDSSANNVGGKIVTIADPNRDPRIGKVKMQRAPVGSDHCGVITNRFFYQPGYTEVYDALGNKKIYRYGKEEKLNCIESYRDEHLLYKKERFFWDNKERMSSRTVEDHQGIVHQCYTFEYNSLGNVTKTTQWGNISGKNSTLLTVKLNGQPHDNGVEKYSTKHCYSEDGQLLIREEQDNGRITHLIYEKNLLTGQILADGNAIKRRTFYKYDNQNTVIEKIEDDGTSFDLNDLSEVTQRQHTHITPKYDLLGVGLPEVIEETYLDMKKNQEVLLKRIEVDYSDNRQVLNKRVYDANGELIFETTHSYDQWGNLVETLDSLGEITQFEYDIHGNQLKSIEKEVETYQNFDFSNRVIKKETWKDNEIITCQTLNYDYAGNLTCSTNLCGNEVHYQYDHLGRLIKTTLPAVLNAEGNTVKPTIKQNYNIFGQIISKTDPKGYCTKTQYNILGKPLAIIYPDGSEETFKYNLDGTLRKHCKQNGSSIVYKRDFLSRVIKEKHFDHNNILTGTKTFSYTSFHLLEETDLNGFKTSYRYDGAGRQIEVKKGNQYRIEISYDAKGQVASKKEWYGENQEEFVLGILERDEHDEVVALNLHNAYGEILKHHECKQPVLDDLSIYDNKQFYNELGQNVLQRTVVNDLGESTITTFDALSRAVTIERQNPLGTLLSSKEQRYDPSGNKVREIHKVIRNGNCVNDYILAWEWGPKNRLETMTEGFGSSISRTTKYQYNSDGQLQSTIKPDQITLFFTYNDNGQIETVSSSDQTVNIEYLYDEMGRIRQAKDLIANSITERKYDASGKLTHEVLGNHLSLSYEYDLLGRLKYLTLPDQSGIRRHYNAAFLTDVERVSSNGESLYTHSYSNFNLQGHATESSMIGNLGNISYYYKNGSIEAICSPYWSQWSEYDSNNKLIAMTTEDPAGHVSHAYNYDDQQQVTSETGLNKNTFSYDSLYNITSINGLECEIDALNQLTTAGSKSLSYDLNGQLSECWDEGTHYLYDYDALGRLICVTKEKESQVYFTYDPTGRRLSKTSAHYDAKNNQYLMQPSEYYLWEGDNEIGMADKNGTIKQLRILGSSLGAEIGAAIAIEINDKLYAPIHDHRGSVRCLVDVESELPIEWYHFTTYGEEQRFTMQYTSTENPWGFCSKRTDSKTGLVYFGKRYYMPQVGRWITKDPLGTPESVNRYAYCLNQPLSRIDPHGLFSFGGLWDTFIDYLGEAYNYSSVRLNALKNTVNFDDFIRPSIGKFGELILGKTTMLLSGFYQDSPESGIHGKGELSDKVRITLINGILNARYDYKQSLDILSDTHGGMNIHYIFDATQGWSKDMFRALFAKCGYTSSLSYQLADTWRDMISEMGGVDGGGLIIHYAHSIGSTHTKNALKLLSPEERAMIRIYTFGSPSTISDSNLESVYNFVNYRDGIPLLDPIGFISGLFGLSDDIIMVGSPWGVPFIEHTLNSGAYYDIIKILGVHFMKHYI